MALDEKDVNILKAIFDGIERDIKSQCKQIARLKMILTRILSDKEPTDNTDLPPISSFRGAMKEEATDETK